MDSPRSGLRRAAIASWALAGIGVAGVAGASALAYVDTFKATAEAPAEEAIPAATEDLAPPSAEDTSVPDVVTATVDSAPATAGAPQAPAPVTRETPAPTNVTTAPTTKRRITPTMVQSPNYSPHVTLSRGS